MKAKVCIMHVGKAKQISVAVLMNDVKHNNTIGASASTKVFSSKALFLARTLIG